MRVVTRWPQLQIGRLVHKHPNIVDSPRDLQGHGHGGSNKRDLGISVAASTCHGCHGDTGANRGSAILLRRCWRHNYLHLSRYKFLQGVKRTTRVIGRLPLHLEIEEDALQGPAHKHL